MENPAYSRLTRQRMANYTSEFAGGMFACVSGTRTPSAQVYSPARLDCVCLGPALMGRDCSVAQCAVTWQERRRREGAALCVQRAPCVLLLGLPVRRGSVSPAYAQPSLACPACLHCCPALHATAELGWWKEHKIWVGEASPPGHSGGYSKLLASSDFCFALMGDGWASRFDDAVVHGCAWARG